MKKEGEDGPEVKGGYIDALIVHASRVQKISDNGKSGCLSFYIFIKCLKLVFQLLVKLLSQRLELLSNQ